MNEIALRQLIGRMASLSGPGDHLIKWAARAGEDLFVVPVLPNDGLNESISIIHSKGLRSGVLVTASPPKKKDELVLRWIAVESATGRDDGDDLPTTPSTTVGDLLRILQPGSSMTIRCGSEEFVFQPNTSQQQITDKQAVKSLRKAISA